MLVHEGVSGQYPRWSSISPGGDLECCSTQGTSEVGGLVCDPRPHGITWTQDQYRLALLPQSGAVLTRFLRAQSSAVLTPVRIM
jgi:hypothetical protein